LENLKYLKIYFEKNNLSIFWVGFQRFPELEKYTYEEGEGDN
jgi:hypothetical protein